MLEEIDFWTSPARWFLSSYRQQSQEKKKTSFVWQPNPLGKVSSTGPPTDESYSALTTTKAITKLAQREGRGGANTNP